jgi:hypothetical protein
MGGASWVSGVSIKPFHVDSHSSWLDASYATRQTKMATSHRIETVGDFGVGKSDRMVDIKIFNSEPVNCFCFERLTHYSPVVTICPTCFNNQ